MNVNDVESPAPTKERLAKIFQKQRELHNKYGPIEARSGVGLALIKNLEKFDIDDIRCQYVLKDYAWRVTEELSEATDSLPYDTDIIFLDQTHYLEELSDALHFMVELCLIAEINIVDKFEKYPNGIPDDLATACSFWKNMETYRDKVDAEYGCWEVISWLGMAMNCLKQKPWKQTHMLTDRKKFEICIQAAFDMLLKVFTRSDIGPQGIYDIYFRKSEVNKFRQRSGY